MTRPHPSGRPGAAPRVLVIAHEPHAGLGRLARTEPFVAAVLDQRRPDQGEPLPTDLDGVAALVVLGGSMAAWEDDVAPWLPATRRLLAEGVERGLPTLGICLGAQLLALAAGGLVERGTEGLEVGLVAVRLGEAAADDALLGPVRRRLGERLVVPHWHGDAIIRLPAGAVRLATGERYSNQAFRLGTAAWGVQYHPEVSQEDWQDWVDGGHGALHVEGIAAADLLHSVQRADRALEELARAHAESFAATW